MRKTVEPIIIHQLGVSGRVKDTHFGVIIEGKPVIINNVDNLDELLRNIKNNRWSIQHEHQ